MSDANPSQGNEEVDAPDLASRLSDMTPERLAEEVISVWDEVLRLEGELAVERQRTRALEMELEARGGGESTRARIVELEEALRVADSRIAQMELLLENERSRRMDEEMAGSEGRLGELQEENTRLLQTEDEQVMLILDMEAQLERLIAEIERIRNSSE